MLRVLKPGLFALVVWMSVGAAAQMPESTDTLRQFYEWGEYDSLAPRIQRILTDTTTAIPDSVRARYLVWLGVARFGQGRLGEARSAFVNALRVNRTERPEPAFVTREVIDLFDATARELREEGIAVRRDDSLRMVQRQNEVRLSTLKKARRGSAGLAAGALALAGALGGAAIANNLASRPIHEKYLDAAREGDLQSYRQYRDQLQRVNRRIAVLDIGCALSGVGGCLLVVRSLRIRQSSVRLRASIEGSQYGLCANVVF